MSLQVVLHAKGGRSSKYSLQQAARIDLITTPRFFDAYGDVPQLIEVIAQESLDIIGVVLGHLVELNARGERERTVAVAVHRHVSNQIEPKAWQAKLAKTFCIGDLWHPRILVGRREIELLEFIVVARREVEVSL